MSVKIELSLHITLKELQFYIHKHFDIMTLLLCLLYHFLFEVNNKTAKFVQFQVFVCPSVCGETCRILNRETIRPQFTRICHKTYLS